MGSFLKSLIESLGVFAFIGGCAGSYINLQEAREERAEARQMIDRGPPEWPPFYSHYVAAACPSDYTLYSNNGPREASVIQDGKYRLVLYGTLCAPPNWASVSLSVNEKTLIDNWSILAGESAGGEDDGR